MDFFKKFFGIETPQRYSDGYYYWGSKPSEGQDFEAFEVPIPNQPRRQWPHSKDPQNFEHEFREMERQFQEMLSPFQQQPGFFAEGIPKFFDGSQSQVPSIEGQEKVDETLDGSPVNSENILAIMEKDRQERRYPMQSPAAVPRHDVPSRFFQLPPGFKSFSRSVSIQTSQRPDGVWETRKVVRDEDGNEQVTVTEHPDRPSGAGTFFSMMPEFGTDFPQPPYSKPERDERGMSLIEKFFGRF